MPGQSSDAPGTAQLVDRNDRVLAEAEVPMVQMVYEVVWSDDHAYIQHFADWDLKALSQTN